MLRRRWRPRKAVLSCARLRHGRHGRHSGYDSLGQAICADATQDNIMPLDMVAALALHFGEGAFERLGTYLQRAVAGAADEMVVMAAGGAERITFAARIVSIGGAPLGLAKRVGVRRLADDAYLHQQRQHTVRRGDTCRGACGDLLRGQRLMGGAHRLPDAFARASQLVASFADSAQLRRLSLPHLPPPLVITFYIENIPISK